MARRTKRKNDDETRLEISRDFRPRVHGEACPKNEKHGPGRIYHTRGRTQKVVCDSCAHTWTETAASEDPLRAYCIAWAKKFEEATRVTADDGELVVALNAADVDEVAKALRELCR